MELYENVFFHRAAYPWQFVESNGTCILRLDAQKEAQQVEICYGDPFWFIPHTHKQPLLERRKVPCTAKILGTFRYSIAIPMSTRKLRYHYVITRADGSVVYLTESGVTDPVSEDQLRPFYVPYVYPEDRYQAPAWARGFVWYQIFPDRFHNGQKNRRAGGFVPTRENFFGGTLQGIRAKIPYLKSLGVEGIYLNPIFSSPSNHRYDTCNYEKIDSLLGEEADLQGLVEELHHAGMKIMLDGVFNHCGWDNAIWKDVCRNGQESPYFDWFLIHDADRLKNSAGSSLTDEMMKSAPVYECFAFAVNMPKWNTANPQVMDYLIGRALEWTKNFHIDAWRLDVPDEVNLHFLDAFHRRMRSYDPDIYIIGEIWQDGGQWLSQSVFDGTMDYPLYFIIRDFALTNTDRLNTFAMRTANWCQSTPEPVHAFQWAFCANHDIPRAMHLASGNTAAVKKAYFLEALLGGNFNVYYGEEIGMDGGEDPDNRRAMDWEAVSQNEEMLEYIKELLALKKGILRFARLKELRLDRVLFVCLDAGDCELAAVVTEADEEITVQISEDFSCLFGNGIPTSDGWRVHDFALFSR